jgi:hypothetical protein
VRRDDPIVLLRRRVDRCSIWKSIREERRFAGRTKSCAVPILVPTTVSASVAVDVEIVGVTTSNGGLCFRAAFQKVGNEAEKFFAMDFSANSSALHGRSRGAARIRVCCSVDIALLCNDRAT